MKNFQFFQPFSIFPAINSLHISWMCPCDMLAFTLSVLVPLSLYPECPGLPVLCVCPGLPLSYLTPPALPFSLGSHLNIYNGNLSMLW